MTDITAALKDSFNRSKIEAEFQYGYTDKAFADLLNAGYADNKLEHNQFIADCFISANSRLAVALPATQPTEEKTIEAIAKFAKDRKLDLIDAILSNEDYKDRDGSIAFWTNALLNAGVYKRKDLASLAEKAWPENPETMGVLTKKLCADYRAARPEEKKDFDLDKSKFSNLMRHAVSANDIDSVQALIMLNGAVPVTMRMNSSDMESFVRMSARDSTASPENRTRITDSLNAAKGVLESGERYNRETNGVTPIQSTPSSIGTLTPK